MQPSNAVGAEHGTAMETQIVPSFTRRFTSRHPIRILLAAAARRGDGGEDGAGVETDLSYELVGGACWLAWSGAGAAVDREGDVCLVLPEIDAHVEPFVVRHAVCVCVRVCVCV